MRIETKVGHTDIPNVGQLAILIGLTGEVFGLLSPLNHDPDNTVQKNRYRP